ncbi:DUF2613 domain-containing protein [Mycobacteroides abscessus]|uniref:DUF2613 domain-containing protein n=1 Tax=Mycobacteroides abscessus TaxID=36809 RepID=UPI000D3E8150|nr:DUF2613 domain-containing protein [Mycobacteroides abscessus]PVB44693.1 DUF2613 domain-containing protein [Mycobacteroides abscessus]
MTRFAVPAAASVLIGLLLGAAAVFGLTLSVEQDKKPVVTGIDPSTAILNRPDYGNRS